MHAILSLWVVYQAEWEGRRIFKTTGIYFL